MVRYHVNTKRYHTIGSAKEGNSIMVNVRGIENPATACHVSCPLLVLAYGVKPLAQAIVSAAPLLHSSSVSALFWQSWAHIVRQLLLPQEQSDGKHDGTDDARAVNPDDFYRRVEFEVGIRVHELGDAVTSLIKLLSVLRQDSVLGELTEALFYSGRGSTVITGKCHGAEAKEVRQRTKITKQKSLPVPFQVSCATIQTGEREFFLHDALTYSLAAHSVDGYQWNPGTFKETTLESAEEQPDDTPEQKWQTSRQLKIHALAPYWLIHADHFTSINGRVRSRQIPCAIPLELDASNYSQLKAIQPSSSKYRLTSAILHLSSDEEDAEDGHYVAIVRSCQHDSTDWVLIDDNKTTNVSEETCLNMLAGCHSSLSENGNYLQASLLVYGSENTKETIDPVIQKLLAKVEETKLHGESLVGRRVEVLWSKGKYYAGGVASFDPVTGKHTIRYDDGDVRAYNLSKKTIRWLENS